MGWIEVEARIEREDHSGADVCMNTTAMARGTGARVKRMGPPGCQGILFLEARGHCCWVKSYVGESK